jgi:serine/threonine protein kinase
MPGTTSCPEVQNLQQLSLGELPDELADALEQHLLLCETCVQTMRMFRAEDTLLAAARARVAEKVPEGPEVEHLVQRIRKLAHSTLIASTVTLASDLERHDRDPTREVVLDGLRPPRGSDELGRLGPYRVLRILGTGGMGIVFAAEDTQLQRSVALKVMRTVLAKDSAHRERFLREARATAAIEHDHIVTVYQVGEDNGIPFFAMPLLQGQTLQNRLDAGGPDARLPVAEVLRIGRETAMGLAAAHSRGLIHRDIKPGNIWLEAGSGRVKILDFGLARSDKQDVKLTKAGYIVGTPHYMAPEQSRSQATLDARTDLFSLGIVLYRMCTGRLPFAGEDLIALLAAVAWEEPRSVQALNPDVPQPLADLVVQLLAKDPKARPPAADTVVEALRRIEQGQVPARSQTGRLRRWLPLTAAALLVAGLPRQRRGSHKPGAPATGCPALSRRWRSGVGGILLAGGILGATIFRLASHRADLSTEPAELGKRGQSITLAPGEVRSFKGHTNVVSSVAFSADGRQAISGSWDRTIRLWDVTTGDELKRFEGHPKTVRSVAISPDGTRLASGGGGDHTVRLWDIATGKEVRKLSGHRDMVTSVVFLAGSKLVVSASLDGTLRFWSAVSGKGLDCLPSREGELPPLEGVAVDAAAHYLLCGGQDRLVYLWDADSRKEVKRWSGHTGVVHCVAFAPGGTWAASGGSDGTVRVWSVADGKELYQLPHPDGVSSVAFTPEGRQMLTGCWDHLVRLWDVAGQRELHRFQGHTGRVGSVTVSSDGRLALSGSHDHTVRLWRLPPTP